MAVPRFTGAGLGGEEIALPQPLSPSEAAQLRRVFHLQARGAIGYARDLAEALDSSTSLGHGMLGTILADRYLGPYTHPDADALQDWLDRWPDLPSAADIRALLLTRAPGRRKVALAEVVGLPVQAPTPVPEETQRGGVPYTRNADLDRSVAEAARLKGEAGVNRLLARTKGLGRSYESQLRGEAARVLFARNQDEEALAMALSGTSACSGKPARLPAHRSAPLCQISATAGLAGGLAAWRLGEPEQALTLFAAGWSAPITTPAQRASSAYWAARAAARSGEAGARQMWLGRAAAEGFTFYGILARRSLAMLGHTQRRRDDEVVETLSEADLDAVAATAPGLRAFALLQAGQPRRAEAEFRLLWPQVADTPSLARAVMLVADQAGLSGLAAQLADLLQSIDGRPRETMRFRVPPLRPDRGFRIDPALLYAIARTESDFDETLVSAAGARGILQIMPETANFVRASLGRPSSRAISAVLENPGVNLDLGQRYVEYLATREGGDLVRILACYNAGPNAFDRWSPGLRDGGDPLLFIEAIPVDETRAYVPRVLAYAWIYATRLHLPAPSLDELASGLWPRYRPWRPPSEGAGRLH